MLRFFKINDPYRILVLIILMLLIRMPFYWSGFETLLPDLHYLLVGERLANGHSLYAESWINIGPLSGVFYSTMNVLFGKSIAALHVVGFILTLVQAFLFNRLCLVNKVFTENTYVPSVIYAVLMSLSVDMFAVSPVMLANTFILLAMNNIFSQIEFRAKRDEKILSIGVYLGVASLFYFPSSILALICVLGLMIFSATIFRRYLLILYGVFLPFMIMATYYYLTDRLSDSWQVFMSSWFDTTSYGLASTTVLMVVALPLFFLLLSIIRVVQGGRFSNYQSRIVQFMLIWILLSSVLLVSRVDTMADLILFVPAFAFFITHYFVLFRRRFWSEVFFTLFLALTIGLSYNLHFDGNKYQPIRIASSRYDVITEGKSVWVIGDDLSIYNNSRVATRYYDWNIFRKSIVGVSNEVKASIVFQDIMNNRPEVIIDKEGLLAELQPQIPMINIEYYLLENGLYIRRQ